MTLMAFGMSGRSQSKCHTKSASFTSHSNEECPRAEDGRAGWVPNISHSPTNTSNCLSELVGCGGVDSAGLFMLIPSRGHVHSRSTLEIVRLVYESSQIAADMRSPRSVVSESGASGRQRGARLALASDLERLDEVG